MATISPAAVVSSANVTLTGTDVALSTGGTLTSTDPDNLAAQSLLASATAGIGENERAIELYDDVLEESPTQNKVLVLRGHAQKTIGRLDDAMVACPSYAALSSELDRYPGIVGYETETFVTLRCARVDDESVRQSAACLTVIDPTTTLPRTTLPDLVFVGGQRVAEAGTLVAETPAGRHVGAGRSTRAA